MLYTLLLQNSPCFKRIYAYTLQQTIHFSLFSIRIIGNHLPAPVYGFPENLWRFSHYQTEYS